MKKIVIMRVVFFLLLGVLATCAKEYSCEGERCGYYKDTFLIPPIAIDKWPPRDTTVTVDTVLNELIAYYDYYIVDNSKVKKMYFNVQDKDIPGHYRITDSIPVQSAPDGYYTGSFDIKNYYDMSRFVKGDTFRYFFDIRYRNGTNLYSDTVTLIY